MVAAVNDRSRAQEGPADEVRLNSWRNPSRPAAAAGRVGTVETSPTKKRPKPAIAIVAVAVPLLAMLVAALVTTASSDEGASTQTTISQSGDPAAAGKSGGSKAGKDDTDTTATTAGSKDEGKGKATTTTAPTTERVPDIPSSPTASGPEGERASVTYPQPTVPASGCARPTGTAVITLGATPFPACLELGPDQPVIVRNRTGKEVSFVAISVNEVIAAGSEMRIGTAQSAFGDGQSTFWSPGNPKLSGIVRVG